MQATFGEKLFYQKKGYTFPPTNCKVCRKAKQTFRGVQGTCNLCHKSYQISAGKMIMILKNESQFRLPTECPHCRNLSPDERRQMEREKELQGIAKKEMNRFIDIYRNPAKLTQAKAEFELTRTQDTAKLRAYFRQISPYRSPTQKELAEIEEEIKQTKRKEYAITKDDTRGSQINDIAREAMRKPGKGEDEDYRLHRVNMKLKGSDKIKTDTYFGVSGTKPIDDNKDHGHAAIYQNGSIGYLREPPEDGGLVLFDDTKLDQYKFILYNDDGTPRVKPPEENNK